MTSPITTTASTKLVELDRKIEKAVLWIINAQTDEILDAAQKLLNDLRYERNAEEFPIVTETTAAGKTEIVIPMELRGARYNTEDMEIFVKRALAFRAGFIRD